MLYKIYVILFITIFFLQVPQYQLCNTGMYLDRGPYLGLLNSGFCSVPTDRRSFRTGPKKTLEDRSVQDLKIAKRTVWWMQFMFCLPSWFQESPELAVKKYLVKQITSPSLVKYIFIMFLSLSRALRPLQIAHVEDLFPQSLFVTPKEL